MNKKMKQDVLEANLDAQGTGSSNIYLGKRQCD